MNDNLAKVRQNTFNVKKAIKLFTEQNNRLVKTLNTEWDFLKYIDEGRLIVIGGGSGLGKTAFVLQMIYELAKKNDEIEAIYATSEMMVEELIMRLIVNQQALKCDMNNVKKEFNTSFTDPFTYEDNVKKAEEMLNIKNFNFINSSDFTLEHIIETIRAIRKKNPTKRIFIVIDYLQLLLLEQESLNAINKVIKSLKDVLIECNANAFVISALNRDSIRNNYVDMSAFKDSSAIEYTSDMAILFAFKKETEKKNITTLKIPEEQREKNEIEFNIHCVKNRIGKMFSIPVVFNKVKQHFDILKKSDFGVIREIEAPVITENDILSELTAYDII